MVSPNIKLLAHDGSSIPDMCLTCSYPRGCVDCDGCAYYTPMNNKE